MLFRLLALQLITLGLFSLPECRGKEDPYEFHLEAELESITGHISHDAETGSKILADIEQPEGHTVGEPQEGVDLKVLIKQAAKTGPPQKQTSPKNFDLTMVTSSHTREKVTRDNVNTVSSTFNHVPTNTARMTGIRLPTVTNTGSSAAPMTQKFTNEPRVVTSGVDPQSTNDDVTVVTRPHTGSEGTLNHNVHLTTGANTASTNNRFRNIIPHGHNIHITHLVHDPVHPAVNKRSIEDRDNVDISRRKQKLRHRKKRHFAVPPEDFQPQNLRRTTAKPPKFVVKLTDAFLVDPVDHYIRVNDTSHIGDHTFISFYVVLEDEDGLVVSNPLPFIVFIDQPEESSSYPVVPAVFAGVLVLCVVFLAFFIPLVTRAKRRYKEGKPMFKLGSHPSRADLEKAGLESQTNMPRNPSEPNWYGNNIYYDYQDEIAKEQVEFSRGLRQYSTKSEPPRLQLHKKKKGPLSDSSSSSGIDSSSQGAMGFDGEDSCSQRM